MSINSISFIQIIVKRTRVNFDDQIKNSNQKQSVENQAKQEICYLNWLEFQRNPRTITCVSFLFNERKSHEVNPKRNETKRKQQQFNSSKIERTAVDACDCYEEHLQTKNKNGPNFRSPKIIIFINCSIRPATVPNDVKL